MKKGCRKSKTYCAGTAKKSVDEAEMEEASSTKSEAGSNCLVNEFAVFWVWGSYFEPTV